ncbi:MAG: hypothetical protein KIT46_07415 [Anaerolineales bacterium]|nr:hypothetical protein [Anaerolineales bacterium]MCW5855857.1 hypothetical protein [Anaerolineales bacterium]
MLTAFLDRLPDMAARNQDGMRSSDFTLERMHALLVALGHPELGLRGVHIAGTHGKGSVAVLCAAALQAAGYRVGLFTSPHAAGALAGIQLNGTVATLPELEATFAGMQSALGSRADWTHFEVVTALAYAHFARQEVDAAVIEAGLGGRLDATNAWTPSVSVITPVDYDHTSILGSQLAQIAAEKAGIIKPGVPVVLAGQAAEARRVLRQAAAEQAALLVEIGEQWGYRTGEHSLAGQQLWVWSQEQPEEPIPLQIGLLGRHQAGNAATAYAALHTLQAASGLSVPRAAVQAGFSAARWPGRFELLQDEPAVVLDAAHSPGAAQALRQALDDYFPGQELVLVLGVSADKDLAGLLAPLQERSAAAIATQSGHARAMPTGALAARLQQAGLTTWAEPDPQQALRAALSAVRPGQLVLVCGSVFLVDQIRQFHRAAKGAA